MRQDLEFYLSLDYPVEIRRLPAEDGGGYIACIPHLGRWMFTAAGDTPDVKHGFTRYRTA